MAATKVNLIKLMYTITVDVVRGPSYKVFLHENLSHKV